MRDFDSLKVPVAGTGYVGLSLSTLISQHHQMTAEDIISVKVDVINKQMLADGFAFFGSYVVNDYDDMRDKVCTRDLFRRG